MPLNLTEVIESYEESLDRASQDDNSLDWTVFYSQKALGALLIGVLMELHSIGKTLERIEAKTK
jgi:hypothetical protein